jgi:hypothetical protein
VPLCSNACSRCDIDHVASVVRLCDSDRGTVEASMVGINQKYALGNTNSSAVLGEYVAAGYTRHRRMIVSGADHDGLALLRATHSRRVAHCDHGTNGALGVHVDHLSDGAEAHRL